MHRVPSISTFEAAKNLKHTGDQLLQIHNRIRLLEEQDRRHHKKIEANQRCLQTLEQKKKRVQEESQERKQRNGELEHNIRVLQEKNRILKDLRVERMNNIREDIYQNKKLECELTKNSSEIIDKKILALKNSHLNKNRERRDHAVLEGEKRKENIKTKELERTGGIRNSTHKVIEGLIDRKEKHEEEIARFQRIEAQLLEKCKESNEMNETLKNQIQDMMGISSLKKTKKTLPSIKSKSKLKYSAESFFRAQSTEEISSST